MVLEWIGSGPTVTTERPGNVLSQRNEHFGTLLYRSDKQALELLLLLRNSDYTPRLKRVDHCYFYDKFGKCKPIIIIFPLFKSEMNYERSGN